MSLTLIYSKIIWKLLLHNRLLRWRVSFGLLVFSQTLFSFSTKNKAVPRCFCSLWPSENKNWWRFDGTRNKSVCFQKPEIAVLGEPVLQVHSRIWELRGAVMNERWRVFFCVKYCSKMTFIRHLEENSKGHAFIPPEDTELSFGSPSERKGGQRKS